MNCLTCGQANPDGIKFCRGCGASFAVVPAVVAGWECAHCHRANRDGIRFCAGCGMSVSKAAAPIASAPPVESAPPSASVATVVPAPPKVPAQSMASIPAATAPPVGACDAVEPANVCQHCGASRQSGVRFCKACGKPTESRDDASAPLSSSVPASVPASATRESRPTSAQRAVESATPANPPIQHASVSRADALPAQPRSGAGKTMVIAAGILVMVAGIGGLVAWKLLRHGNVAADQSTQVGTTNSSAPIEAPRGPAPPPIAAVPEAATPPAMTPQPPAATLTPAIEPAVPPTPMSASKSMVAANVEAQRGSGETAASAQVPESPPAPASLPPREVRAPARATGPSMQEIALRLVRKGEQAYAQQNYSSAIANAKAALEVKPDDAHASRLLREAQSAQQSAMNSISIH